MATIVTRSGKGSPLTNTEVDSNFTNLNTDKLELSGGTMTGTLTLSSTYPRLNFTDTDSNSDFSIINANGLLSVYDVTNAANRFTIASDGTSTFSGEITANGGIALGDSDKATFGASDDLQIYHDGSNSYIKDLGTGNLAINTNGSEIMLTGQNGSEYMIRAIQDGAVELYNNGSPKLATSSVGISVTGTVLADGLTVGDNEWIYAGNGADLKIGHSITESIIRAQGLPLYIDANDIYFRGYSPYTKHMFIASSGDISFYEDTGTTAKFFWDASAESLGIGTVSPTKTLSVLGDAIIKNTTDGTYLTLHSTQANNASGPDIVLFRDSTSPADDDALSTIFWQGKNSAGSTKDYMKLRSYILDVTDGTEDFGMDIQIMTSGNAVNALDILPTEMVINNASIDRDFRVESNGNANMLFVDGGNDRVGIGRVPSISNSKLEVGGADNVSIINVEASGVTGGMGIGSTGLQFFHGSSAKMRIDSSGNVGIGVGNSKEAMIQSTNSGRVAGNPAYSFNGDLDTGMFNPNINNTIAFATGAAERMRIDSSGNVLVGQQTASSGAVGTSLRQDGRNFYCADGNYSAHFNRKTSDGDVVLFAKNDTVFGSIGVATNINIGSGSTRIWFKDDTNSLRPISTAIGNGSDGVISLGEASGGRFKDLYLSGNITMGSSAQINASSALYIDSDIVHFRANNETERMRIDSSGNVGIGLVQPLEKLHSAGRILSTTSYGSATQQVGTSIGQNAAVNATVDFRRWTGGGTNHGVGAIEVNDSGVMAFYTDAKTTNTVATSERMRIDSDGNVLINCTSENAYPGATFSRETTGTTLCSNTTASGYEFQTFRYYNGQQGVINLVGTSGVNYGESSDYRLKENVSYTWDATTKLKQLKPAQFSWISDETNTRQDGFIAHEVAEVVPRAVCGEKDAMEPYVDEDGDDQTRIKPQQLDTGKLVPLLVKAMQEQQALIESLTDRIAALEE